MKYVFVLFLVISQCLPGQGQECVIKKETDPFTRETRVSTGFMQLGGASVTVDADGKEIDVLFSVEGVDKCFDNSSGAAIYFEGSKVKLTLKNGGTMNCEGLFHFIFRNTATTQYQLNKLLTEKITHIIFTGNNKKETKVILTPEQQERFRQLGNCLVTEAKTLIK